MPAKAWLPTMCRPAMSTNPSSAHAAMTPLRPVQSQSLVEQIHGDLHFRIAAKTLPEGTRLVINALAREYGTSLIPVREALIKLHGERYVSFERNKGYTVAKQPDATEMRQLFEARLVLELGAAEYGFERASLQDVKQLEQLNQEMRALRMPKSAADYQSFVRKNEDFHRLLVGLPANPYLSDAYDRLGYHQRVLQVVINRISDDFKKICTEHEAIVSALRAKDKKALLQAMRHHIVQGSLRIF